MVYVQAQDGRPLMPTENHGMVRLLLDRQIHKMTIGKGGKRKLNQSRKHVHGHQLYDQVKLGKTVSFVFGRRTSGSFDVRTLDGAKVSADISYKKLKPLKKRQSVLTERRVSGICSHG